MDFRLVSLLIVLTTSSVRSYKVLLVSPGHSNSNIMLYYRLGDLLASRGHDVFIHVAKSHKGVSSKMPKLAKSIHYDLTDDPALAIGDHDTDHYFDDVSPVRQMAVYMDFLKKFTPECERQISDKNLMTRLRNENFDIGIGHMYCMCPLGMFRALNISTYIWMSSGPLWEHMAWYAGIPTPASFVPNTMSAFSDKMTLVERIQNLLGVSLFHLVYGHVVLDAQTSLFRKHFGSHFPHLTELAAKSQLIFVNTDELADFPRPIMHKVVHIGGIDRSQPEPLTQEWKDIMETSNKGVVLFSMGTVVRGERMPAHWKVAFLEAFSRFPDYTFIWKFEAPFPEAAKWKHIKVVDWVPQRDLLTHPKLKVFITHCGLNSYMESVSNGVPILSFPIFGDQPSNAQRAERHGVAVRLAKSEVNGETVYQKLKTILTDPKYSINAKKLSSMIKKKPVKPDDLAVGWVEFLAEHKELPNLQPVSAEMSFIEYFMIDAAIILILSIVVFLYVVQFTVKYVFYRCFFNGKKLKEE